jgi:antitoxin component YwqK of YwqJK toxin-antitoxin module
MWKAYYTNGKLMYKGKYSQGNPDGQQVLYYDTGKIKEEQYYQNGIREKTWKKFNEDGLLFLAISYKNDLETSINGVKIKLPESDAKLIK